MSGIVLSAAVRQNLLSLQSTAALLATTQNDLVTGNKVNTALDNPTEFFTAQGLNNRASDIGNLLDSIGNGVQVLQAANTGITSLQSLIADAPSIANQVLRARSAIRPSPTWPRPSIAGATANNLLVGPPPAATATSQRGQQQPCHAGCDHRGDRAGCRYRREIARGHRRPRTGPAPSPARQGHHVAPNRGSRPTAPPRRRPPTHDPAPPAYGAAQHAAPFNDRLPPYARDLTAITRYPSHPPCEFVNRRRTR